MHTGRQCFFSTLYSFLLISIDLYELLVARIYRLLSQCFIHCYYYFHPFLLLFRVKIKKSAAELESVPGWRSNYFEEVLSATAWQQYKLPCTATLALEVTKLLQHLLPLQRIVFLIVILALIFRGFP